MSTGDLTMKNSYIYKSFFAGLAFLLAMSFTQSCFAADILNFPVNNRHHPFGPHAFPYVEPSPDVRAFLVHLYSIEAAINFTLTGEDWEDTPETRDRYCDYLLKLQDEALCRLKIEEASTVRNRDKLRILFGKNQKKDMNIIGTLNIIADHFVYNYQHY